MQSSSTLKNGGDQEVAPALTSRRFGIKAKLLVLAVTTTLATLGLEGVLALMGAFKPFPTTFVGEFENRPSDNFLSDPVTGWRMRPNHILSLKTQEMQAAYQSNTQGFRAAEDFKPAETRKRIVLAGDSFTFGYGVEYDETFGALIENELTDVVVCNLAMPGFGLDQIWLSVRHQALPLDPDLVIVGLVNVDFKRSQVAYRKAEGFNKPTFSLVNGRLVPRTAEDRPNFVLRFLEEHSRIWTGGRLGSRWFSYRLPLGEWWHLNEAILDAIRCDCAETSTPVLFINIPTKAWRRFPMLNAHMERTGADYIDATENKPPNALEYFFAVDSHINAAGNRYVAGLLVRWIRENLPGAY